MIKTSGKTVVEQNASSSSHQESSSQVQSSSSSFVVKIVNGVETLVDKKQNKSGCCSYDSNDERLALKSGTNISPEEQYIQTSEGCSSVFHSAVPELKETVDNISSNDLTKDSRYDSSAMKKTTYYDSRGNVIKTVFNNDTNVIDGKSESEKYKTPTTSRYVNENYVDFQKIRDSEQGTNSDDFYGHGMDSKNTFVTNVYDSKAVQNTIGTEGHILMDQDVKSTDVVFSNDRNYGKTGWNGTFTYEQPKTIDGKAESEKYKIPKTSTPKKSSSPLVHHITTYTDNDSVSKDSSVKFVDEDHVDFQKIRDSQLGSNSNDFYGHGVDSRNTIVSNIYDTKAVQNTIGTKGHILKDQDVKTTGVVFSNDRNYGKTGWDGTFTYEQPKTIDHKTESEKYKLPTTSASKKSSTSDVHHIITDKDHISKDKTVRYVDENYVDFQKIRDSQLGTSSNDFYGHGMDSRNTLVGNTYDSKAVQNTIGTKGHILMDQDVKSTDVVFSNDRNYGKTGWNGTFTYEQPQKKPQNK